jgi:hypothetical protein
VYRRHASVGNAGEPGRVYATGMPPSCNPGAPLLVGLTVLPTYAALPTFLLQFYTPRGGTAAHEGTPPPIFGSGSVPTSPTALCGGNRSFRAGSALVYTHTRLHVSTPPPCRSRDGPFPANTPDRHPKSGEGQSAGKGRHLGQPLFGEPYSGVFCFKPFRGGKAAARGVATHITGPESRVEGRATPRRATWADRYTAGPGTPRGVVLRGGEASAGRHLLMWTRG